MAVARRSSTWPTARASPSRWSRWSCGEARRQRVPPEGGVARRRRTRLPAERAARSLVQQRTHTVGALLSDMGNPWFIDLLDSVRSELPSLGLNLFLSEAHPLEANSSVLDAFIEAQR